MKDDSLDALHALSPTLALPRLESLSERASVLTAEARDALARTFPRMLAGLSPEVQIAVGKLALRLLPEGPSLPKDLDDASAEVRVAWHRFALARESVDLAAIDDGALHSALSSWPIERVRSPREVLTRCAKSADASLARYTTSLLRDAIAKAAITPEDGLACAVLLAEHPAAEVREASITSLIEPFARTASPGRIARAIGKLASDANARVRIRAIDAASGLGDRDTLLRALHMDDPEVVASAIQGLAGCATRDDLRTCLALSTADTLRFGEPLRALLLGAHLHGAFVQPGDVESLLEVYDTTESFTAEELARVTYTVRNELVETLARLDVRDPRWAKRAAVLAHTDGRDATRVISDMLGKAEHPEHAVPFLHAAALSPGFADANAITPWLSRLPHASLEALATIEGDEAAEIILAALSDHLAFDEARPKAITHVWSRITVRKRVIEALGVEMLSVAALGALELGAREQAAVLLERLASTPIADRLESIADVCDIDHVEVFESLFRDGFREAIETAHDRPRDWSWEGNTRDVVISRLLAAATKLGRRLRRIGRLLPSMREHDDLAVVFAVRFVSELGASHAAKPSDPSLIIALIESLGLGRLHPPDLRALRTLVRHRDADVRRAFMEVSLASRDTTSGLAFSLCRLAKDEEPKALRQALRSIGVFQAGWAERYATAGLEHPNMNIKRAAAAALAIVGTPASVPSILGWLGRHDNRGFREDLLRALDRAAGLGANALLLAALDAANGKSRELLGEALDRRLDVATVVRVTRDARPSHAWLIEKLFASELTLRAGTLEELRDALRRNRVPVRDVELRPALETLEARGFTDASAHAALEEAITNAPAGESIERSKRLDRAVASRYPEWVRFALSLEGEKQRAAVTLVLAQYPEDAAIAVAEQIIDCALAMTSPEELALAFDVLVKLSRRADFSRLRARAIALVRSRPPTSAGDGLARWETLGRIGCARTPLDLKSALGDCRLSSTERLSTESLLRNALDVHVPSDARVLADFEHNDEPSLREPRDFAALCAVFSSLPPERASTLLERALALRPLGAPRQELVHATISRAPRRSIEHLVELERRVDDPSTRAEAVRALLAFHDERARAILLVRFLAGTVTLPTPGSLAPQLTNWPTNDDEAKRAVALVSSLPEHRMRAFASEWLAAWRRGARWAEPALKAANRDLITALIAREIEAGRRDVLPLLRVLPAASTWLQDVLKSFGDDVAAHLGLKESEPEKAPLATQPLHAPALIARVRSSRGEEALFALKQLLTLEGEHASVLRELTEHVDHGVRIAALRGLRRHAPRDVYLESATEMLRGTSKASEQAQLVRILGHARHAPATPLLIACLESSDAKLVKVTSDALRASGEIALAPLRRAAGHARPDRRARYDAIIRTIAGDENASR